MDGQRAFSDEQCSLANLEAYSLNIRAYDIKLEINISHLVKI